MIIKLEEEKRMIEGMHGLPKCECGNDTWKEGSESLSSGAHQAQYQCKCCNKVAMYFHSGQCTFFLISDPQKEIKSWLVEFNKLMGEGWGDFRDRQEELARKNWKKICERYNVPDCDGIESVPVDLRETFIKLHTEFLNSKDYAFPEGLEPIRPKQELGEGSKVYFLDRKKWCWQ